MHDVVKIAQLVVPFLGRIVAFLVHLPRFNPPEFAYIDDQPQPGLVQWGRK